jgi:hypothetical protein
MNRTNPVAEQTLDEGGSPVAVSTVADLAKAVEPQPAS